MKLLDLLKELEKPTQVYTPGGEPEEEISDISQLTPQQRKDLFDKGFLIIGSKVVNLPKLEEKKRNISNSRKDFEVFQYYPDNNVKAVAKEINKLHNQLYNAIKVLDKVLELKKSGKV